MTTALEHYDAQLREAQETRQKLLLNVRRQYEYLELPMPAALESWGIPALQERLAENAGLISPNRKDSPSNADGDPGNPEQRDIRRGLEMCPLRMVRVSM